MIIKIKCLFVLAFFNCSVFSQTVDIELTHFLKIRNQFSDSINISNDVSLFKGTYFINLEKYFYISSSKISIFSFGSNGSHAKTYAYVQMMDKKKENTDRVIMEMNNLHFDIEKLETFFSKMSDLNKLEAYKKIIPVLIALYKKNL